jgi:MFS family permease
MVAEMVPEKELQPRAFSVMPLVWNMGSIFGPSLGGFFAKPAESFPSLFGKSKFLIAFPFVLPNIVASGFFLIGISTGILFLKVCSNFPFHYPTNLTYSGNAGNKKAQKRLWSSTGLAPRLMV